MIYLVVKVVKVVRLWTAYRGICNNSVYVELPAELLPE